MKTFIWLAVVNLRFAVFTIRWPKAVNIDDFDGEIWHGGRIRLIQGLLDVLEFL